MVLLHFDNEHIRGAVGLRFGTALCETHRCPYGALVYTNGLHELSGKSNSGKNARHSNINDLACRALKWAEIPAIVEPTELSRTARRAITLTPWKAGKSTLWYVIVVSTMATILC